MLFDQAIAEYRRGGWQRLRQAVAAQVAGAGCGALDRIFAPGSPEDRVSAPTTVLVHQMGKVGSSAIRQSLENGGIPCLQTHALGREALCSTLKFLLDPHTDVNRVLREQPVLRDQVIATKLVEQSRAVGAGYLKVVTLSREPVDRWFSALLQNYLFHLTNAKRYFLSELGREPEDDLECFSAVCRHLLAVAQSKTLPLEPQRLFRRYWRGRLARDPEADYHLKQIGGELILPLAWFVTQLKRPVGMNLFDVDVSNGIAVSEHGGVELLFLKYELLRDHPQMAQQALSAFVKGEVKIGRSNVSREKPNYATIEKLRRRYEADFRLSRLVRESVYCRHFGYT